MSIANRWRSLLLALFLLPALVSAASGSGSRTMDYAWLLLLKVNVPPQVDAGENQGISGNTASLSASVVDDPKDTLTYHWVQDSGPGTANFDDEFLKETLATFTASGTYTLKFTADDGEFESSDIVIITVTNTTPNVNAGGDKQIIHPTNSVSLSGSVSDGENNVEGISWSIVSGPGGVSFSNPSSAVTSVTFSSGAVGIYVLRLSASDWEFTPSDTVTVNYLPQPVHKIDVVVAIGDSITVGFGDERSCQPYIPGTPLEEIDKSCDGYTIPLAPRLSGANGYADTVYIRERGTVGVTSAYGRDHIQEIVNFHTSADQYLVMYGTNDADQSPPITKEKFKSNMEKIIQVIKGKNMEPVLAYIPYAKYPHRYLNGMIQEYNSQIHYNLNIPYQLKEGPSLYSYFYDHQDQLNTYNINTGNLDGVHPTHNGYYNMALKWANALIQ